MRPDPPTGSDRADPPRPIDELDAADRADDGRGGRGESPTTTSQREARLGGLALVYAPERRMLIIRLLSSRDDHLPGVAGSRRLASAGFQHRVVVRESCEDCLANGRVMRGCEVCRGRGYVERVRDRDPYDTGKNQGWFAESARRHERARERDREIERLGEQVAPARPEAELLKLERGAGWERARAVRWARFDFGALDSALERLRVVDPWAYHAVMERFVYGYGWGVDAEVERGLEALSGWLPERLRVPET